jgi:predicted permease
MGIPVASGRDFDSRDVLDSAPVAIISESTAKRLWGSGNPIGKRFKYGPADSRSPWQTVVGVARDVRSPSLEDDPGLCIYVPYSQMIAGAMTFVVRAEVEPLSLASAVTHEIWEEDREQAVFSITTMDRLLEKSLWPRRIAVQLLVFFAVSAVALAAIGVHGVMAWLVSLRRQEFGIRLALGATRREVVGMVLAEASRLAVMGICVGLAVAVAAAQWLRALLYAVSPTDVWTFAGALFLLPSVALCAACLSAWRATRTDPLETLRVGQ